MDIQKLNKETKILIGIFIFALLIRILFVFISPVKWWDETVYADLGYGLSKSVFDYSFANGGWSDFIGDNMWPKAGFRAPLLPYTLSIFYFLKLDFLINFLMPLIGALSVVLVYLLGKRMFNDKIGIYSALFLSLVPLHIYFSGKILTDVFSTFLLLLSILSFWKGYEEDNKFHKIFFGFLLALSLSSRYTMLWVIPVFFIFLWIRNKSLKFLKDKFLWYAVLVFFFTLIPWFVYSSFTYGNPLGAFIHGSKAASYWGGSQPWFFFFGYSLEIFSIIGILFLFSLIYIIIKREFKRKEIYFSFLLIFTFLLIAMLMPHKEERFLLPIIPIICILCAFFINKIKKFKKTLLLILIITLVLPVGYEFINTYRNSYTSTEICFLKGNIFLKNVESNSLVITDESPITFYYSKKETRFFIYPINSSTILNLARNYANRPVYALTTDYDASYIKDIFVRQDLDSRFEKVYNCLNKTIIYKVQ